MKTFAGTTTLAKSLTSTPVATLAGLPTVEARSTDDTKLEATESAPNADLIAIADFNRIYSTGDTGGRSSMTKYGEYFNTLESCHSIGTEDVSYVIQKCLDNDATGAWTGLKDSVDASIADADDLVSDLASFLNAVEKVESALDISREDKETTDGAAEYLKNIGQRSYEKSPDQLSFAVPTLLSSEPLGDIIASKNNSKIFKSFIDVFRDDIIFSDEKKSAIEGLQKDINVNPVWDLIDSLGSNSYSKLSSCSEILSKVLTVSSGIPGLEQDDINSKLSFSSKTPAGIFYGTKAFEKVPFGQKLTDMDPSKTISLSFLQYHLKGGTVLPLEINEPTVRDNAGRLCKSGPKGLVRQSIFDGDFNFSDLDSYVQTGTGNFNIILKYLNYMTGRFDTENRVTPPEIMRIIVSKFIEATKEAQSSQDSKLHFAALASAGFNNVVFESDSGSGNLRQWILRIVGRMKWYQLQGISIAQGDAPSEVGKITLTTVRTTEGSSRLSSDAVPNTTQVEDKSGNVNPRILERRSSAAPASDIMAEAIYRLLARSAPLESSGDASSYEESVDAAIEYVVVKIYDTKSEGTEDQKAAIWNIEKSLGIDVFGSSEEDTEKSLRRLNSSKIEATLALPDFDEVDFSELARALVRLRNNFASLESYEQSGDESYDSSDKIKSSFENVQSSTSTNVFGYILGAYDEILAATTERLPTDTTFTDENGFTRYCNLDESAILSLIVECFVNLAGVFKKPNITRNSDSYTDSGFSLSNYDVSGIESYRESLGWIISNNYSTSATVPAAYPEPSKAFSTLMDKHQKVQGCAAYVSSHLSVLAAAKEELITVTNDLLASSARSSTLSSESGRKMLSDLTTQQIIYRKSMLDKYRPQSSIGYLPSRVVYSEDESNVLKTLLASSTFARRSSENIRITAIGVPTGFLPSTMPSGATGMIEVGLYRKDHEFDDIVFKSKTYRFDPFLFIQPGAFSNFSERRSFTSDDYIFSLARRANYTLYSRDGKQSLTYDELKSNSRYSALGSKAIQEIVKNTFLSYMMEAYLYKLCGKIFDETLGLKVDDSTSAAGRAALKTSAGLGLPDLVLPSSTQLDQMFGSDGEIDYLKKVDDITTGDKELIGAITSSFLMRNDTVVGRTILSSKFDRTFLIPFDLDEFEIDLTSSTDEGGELAKSMISALLKRGWIKSDEAGRPNMIINRDPINGGTSIGNICCQISLDRAPLATRLTNSQFLG